MKIAQILGSDKPGGAELYFERLSIALANSGETLLPIIRKGAALGTSLQAAGLTPHELNFRGPFDFLTRWQLKKLLKEFNPKIVFAWMNRAARHSPKGDWILVGRLGGYYNLKYYQHCDYLVANTPLIRDWIIQQGWPGDRVYYLPNFSLDLKSTQTDHLNPVPVILSAGRLHPSKGFDTLIRALKFISNAKLCIAGEGSERSSLEKLIKAEALNERVELLGWNTDMKSLLSNCDVFVCPSRYEPLGNVIIEGFSAQKPVVATKTDGACSLIVDEYSGLLANIDEPEALARQITRCLSDSDLRDRIARNARNEFETKYSEITVVEQWKKFMLTLEKN